MGHHNIIKLHTTLSTSDYLKDMYLKGIQKNNDVVWALDQTRGRGQSSNRWISSKEQSLTFSIFKEIFDLQQFQINALTALSLVKTLVLSGVSDVHIKWSNDIMAGGYKVAGILIENIVVSGALVGSIIGVGINVNHLKAYAFPYMASLRMVTGKHYEIKDILLCFLEQFDLCYLKYQKNGFVDLMDEYSTLLWRSGLFNELIVDGKPTTAKLLRIDRYGIVQIQFLDGNMAFHHHGKVKMNYPDPLKI